MRALASGAVDTRHWAHFWMGKLHAHFLQFLLHAGLKHPEGRLHLVHFRALIVIHLLNQGSEHHHLLAKQLVLISHARLSPMGRRWEHVWDLRQILELRDFSLPFMLLIRVKLNSLIVYWELFNVPWWMGRLLHATCLSLGKVSLIKLIIQVAWRHFEAWRLKVFWYFGTQD